MGSIEFVYNDNGESQRFSFDSRDLTIGRAPDCDFVLDHPTVSRQHARLVDDGPNGYRLIVLSEKGLTAVDGQKVSGEVTVRHGSELYFGRLSFEFRDKEANQGGTGMAQKGRGSEGRTQGTGGREAGDNRQGERAPGGTQWDSYESEVADDPVGGAAGNQDAESMGEGVETGEMSQEEELRESAGIESWDDIAESAKDDAKPDAADLPSNRDDYEEEETNPALILVAVAAAGFMGWTFFMGGGGKVGPDDPTLLDEDKPPVQIQVDCLEPPACMRKATQAYKVGTQMLENQEAELTNLFNGYKKLLQARALIEKAEKEPQKKFEKLGTLTKRARKQLDETFRNYRVMYRTAQKEGNHRRMARALQTIQRYFPDKTAQEYRWAREKILQMKEENTYPDDF